MTFAASRNVFHNSTQASASRTRHTDSSSIVTSERFSHALIRSMMSLMSAHAVSAGDKVFGSNSAPSFRVVILPGWQIGATLVLSKTCERQTILLTPAKWSATRTTLLQIAFHCGCSAALERRSRRREVAGVDGIAFDDAEFVNVARERIRPAVAAADSNGVL